MFYVHVKSGTNGYYDEDGCDMMIAEIESDNIPMVGEILFFGDQDNRNQRSYLVREVKRVYHHGTGYTPPREWVYVYVINYG